MRPTAIYVDDHSVSVLWGDRGPYVTLHCDGSVSEQFREPRGMCIPLGDGFDPEFRSGLPAPQPVCRRRPVDVVNLPGD